MHQHRPAHPRARHHHVGDLEAHADGEREVGKIDIGRLLVLGKIQPVGPPAAVVQVRVAKGVERVRHQPREHHRQQRETGPELPLEASPGAHLAKHEHRGEQTEQAGEHGECPDQAAPRVFGAGAALGLLRAGAHQDIPGHAQQAEGAGVPSEHRTDPPIEMHRRKARGHDAHRRGQHQASARAPGIEEMMAFHPGGGDGLRFVVFVALRLDPCARRRLGCHGVILVPTRAPRTFVRQLSG